MSTVTHQTIKLAKGKHRSPDEGACVMELASMLAGEPFSDHPQSVCPVIGSLLRAYNDSIGDVHRQDLYAYAAKVVGSRASHEVQRARLGRMETWISERRSSGSNHFLRRCLRSLRPAPHPETMGLRALSAITPFNRYTHHQVLALIDELLELGAQPQAPTGDRAAARSATAASCRDEWARSQ